MSDGGYPEVADPMVDYGGGGGGFCCCFAPLYSRRNSVSTQAEWWDRMPAGGIGIGSGVNTSGWWNKGIGVLMKVREWSELVAGPRWKTFIRRFNRNSRCSRIAQRFQYDPLSYALNFDDSVGASDGSEPDAGFGDLSSSRYAITPPAKPRMELNASPDYTIDRPRALMASTFYARL